MICPKTNIFWELKFSKTNFISIVVDFYESYFPALKKSMQQSNARKAFKLLSEYFVMVNAVDDEEPFEEEYRPDGKYIPRLLFLDKNGDLLPDIKNKKAEYKNYSYYYSSPADILNSMKDVLRYFEIEVPNLKKGESLKAKKPEKKRSHADGPEPPQKGKKEKEEKETKEEKPEENKPERVEPKKESKKEEPKKESKKEEPKKESKKESKKEAKKGKSEL